ncbi:MAG: SpoIIE family protein phosphatase [Coriobacteriales bacterium]|jgi:serine phosphatase RsbU (regulator of sigma subunit)/anti-sigma regulatory factor (Ser/Thr protein kinase)
MDLDLIKEMELALVGKQSDATLRSTFYRWLLLAMAAVFVVTSALLFTNETLHANKSANIDLNRTLDYLQLQVEDREERTGDLKDESDALTIQKAKAAAELVAADPSTLTSRERLANLADELGLVSITITDSNGVVVADSEYGSAAAGFSYESTAQTDKYMRLIYGGDPVIEEPRLSVAPDGTLGDERRVFCGVPRKDQRGIVQVSIPENQYLNLLSATSLDSLANDYESSGTIAIIEDYRFITVNRSEFADQSVVGTIVDSEEEFDALVAEGTVKMTDRGAGTRSMVKFRTADDCVLMASIPLSQVYSSRTSTLFYSTILFVILFFVIFFIATRVLRSIVIKPIQRTNLTLGHITAGDLNERVNEHRVREFTSLSNGINTTVAALRLSIEEAEQRNAQELLTAKAIQESAMPSEFPAFPDIDKFDIYASMKTAKEVGGDFYDFFAIGGDKVGFLIADVSGKGIPAALFMMTAKTQIRTYMESGIPLVDAVTATNHQLCIGNEQGMFVTMFACELEYETGKLTYVNAGHNPPMLHKGDDWIWLRDVSGIPLGLFDGTEYEGYSCDLVPGDTLYLYTDGVTEAMDVDGNQFGEERLVQCLQTYIGTNPRSVSVGVRRAITEFTLDCDQSDDITMLALKYGVAPEKAAVMILPARVDQLVHVYNFIHEELKRRHAPKSAYNPLDIAAEELFVNVCHYAYPDATDDDPGEVRVGFEYHHNPPSLSVSISDSGIPYNPLAKPDAVTPDDIADVPIGGLGILMAKKSVDEMTYEREGDLNVVTFKKAW